MENDSADLEVGTRVGAFCSAEGPTGQRKLELFGYGTYQGKQVPTKADFDDIDDEVIAYLKEMGGLPKILLDNGEFVWGHECWWELEADIKQLEEIAKNEGGVKMISPTTFRNEMKAMEASLSTQETSP